ncbi:hypothetical protein, partial [uncultured Campylobacter sp.]|uniref:hypothetical protein n=1 Tax=uncultured Campylobacter sp. TaxID=218934 RepID=UPI00262375CA
NNTNVRYSVTGTVANEYGARGKATMELGKDSKALIYSEFEYKRDIIKNQKYNNGYFNFENRKFKIGAGIGFEMYKNLLFSIGGGYQISDVTKHQNNVENVRKAFPYYEAKLNYDTRDSLNFATKGIYFFSNYTLANSKEAKFNSLNFPADLSLLKVNLTYNLAKFQGAKVRKNIKYLIYKFLLGNVFLAIFVISFYVVSWHIENISNIDLMSLLKGYFLFPGDIRLPFTTAILELFAFYISSSLSDFYVKEVDRKLNFIFFIAFATIGILALTAVTYIIVFGFMLFGLDLDKKLVAILSAAILFIGTYSTAFSFRKSNYELGKFLQIVSLKRRWNANEALSSILLFIGIIIWLNFIVFESK